MKELEDRLAELLAAGRAPYEALLDAVTLLHPADPERLARSVLAIVADFEPTAGTSAMVLARVTEAFQRAVVELQHAASTELNLPFLFADASGPKHLQRTLRAADLEALATGTIAEPPPAPTPAPHPVPAKKKRGWWPF